MARMHNNVNLLTSLIFSFQLTSNHGPLHCSNVSGILVIARASKNLGCSGLIFESHGILTPMRIWWVYGSDAEIRSYWHVLSMSFRSTLTKKCQNICAVVWIGATYRYVLESMHIEIASDSVHDSVRQIISFILADIKFLVPGTKELRHP